MAPQMRVRLYREFLTPALHRRFTRAAAGVLLVCYLEAVLIGSNPSLLWSWFPLGFAGIRTLLIFISALTIFILRVAQLHFGARVTTSPFHTVQQSLSNLSVIRTPAFYLFSAWWFGEVYKWSASKHADLGLVAEGKSYERQRLNERPIYLFILLLVLAISQSGLHLYHDYDSIDAPEIPVRQGDGGEKDASHRKAPSPLERLQNDAPSILFRMACQVGAVNMITPVVYMILRRWAWNPALFLARLVWSVPKASEPSWRPPFLSFSMPWRALVLSALLVFLWEAANAVFHVYVSQEPLEKGQPLTSDSIDPNGSLLTGLKAKKNTVRAFAFWELALIARGFEARRSTIFTEIERAGGSTWSQILQHSLATIRSIETRVAEHQAQGAKPSKPLVTVESLPRISAPAAYLDGSPSTGPGSQIGDLMKSFSTDQSPGKAASPSPQQNAKLLLHTAQTKLLTPAQQQALSPDGLSATLRRLATHVLQSPLGHPFRQPFARRLAAILFSTGPSSSSSTSDLRQTLHAIDALTALLLVSLTDDRYGLVNKALPTVARTFATTLQTVERMTLALPVHWTDVDFGGDGDEHRRRCCPDAELLVAHLRASLALILRAFGHYAVELGLGRAEMGELRMIAGTAAQEGGGGGGQSST